MTSEKGNLGRSDRGVPAAVVTPAVDGRAAHVLLRVWILFLLGTLPLWDPGLGLSLNSELARSLALSFFFPNQLASIHSPDFFFNFPFVSERFHDAAFWCL